MQKCTECGLELEDKDALIHKNSAGEQRIICKSCFHRLTGIDYETFAYRKENAKQTFFAVLFCLAATAYAGFTRGWEWAVGGIVLTVLVYMFASKVR